MALVAGRIGAYRQIIPVISKPNVPREQPPPQEPVQPGIKWSKQSTFKYSTLEIDPVPVGTRFGGSAVVKHPARIKFETRVEDFPEAVMWRTQDYQWHLKVSGFLDPELNFEQMVTDEVWFEAWYFLGSETQQEITGYQSSGGDVTPRFRSREVEYYLHLRFRNNVPNKVQEFHKYGELPPL